MGRTGVAADVQSFVVTLGDNGETAGTISSDAAHAAPGIAHLAVSLQVVDLDGRWLLQRRAGSKATFAGCWANTCCTHPAPWESPDAAVIRRVREELGLVVEDLMPCGAFSYRASDAASGLVEHELDHVFVVVAGTDSVVCCPAEVSDVARLPFAAAWDVVTSARGAPWAAEVLSRAATVLAGSTDGQ
jgi:isopentenyl-diphosphate delta-isomerase